MHDETTPTPDEASALLDSALRLFAPILAEPDATRRRRDLADDARSYCARARDMATSARFFARFYAGTSWPAHYMRLADIFLRSAIGASWLLQEERRSETDEDKLAALDGMIDTACNFYAEANTAVEAARLEVSNV